MESDREGGLADASVRLLQQELTASDQEAVTVRQTSTVQQQVTPSLLTVLRWLSPIVCGKLSGCHAGVVLCDT